MNDETRRILDLLAQGKITVDEADQLLRAVGQARPEPPPAGPSSDRSPRYLRVNIRRMVAWPGVLGASGSGDSQPNREVNIRVPVSLVRSGIRLGSMIPGFASEEVTRHLRERGIDVDFSKLDEVGLENLLKNLGELTVDVDRGRAQMRITCE